MDSRCGARNCLTTKYATYLVWLYSNLRLAKRTQSLEEQDIVQPSMVLSEEEEEEEEERKRRRRRRRRRRGPAVGETSVMRIRELH